MKFWSKNFFLDAFLDVKFFNNFLMKIVGDVLKNSCIDTVPKRLQYRISG